MGQVALDERAFLKLRQGVFVGGFFLLPEDAKGELLAPWFEGTFDRRWFGGLPIPRLFQLVDPLSEPCVSIDFIEGHAGLQHVQHRKPFVRNSFYDEVSKVGNVS